VGTDPISSPVAVLNDSRVEVDWDVGTAVALSILRDCTGLRGEDPRRPALGEGKQSPEILEFKSINEAMAVANDEARKRGKEIVEQWRQS
jgi:hypothetical protein